MTTLRFFALINERNESPFLYIAMKIFIQMITIRFFTLINERKKNPLLYIAMKMFIQKS